MNHYELIFIVNPQQSKESKLFDKCKDQISAVGGELHRAEDIGLRDLAYQIDDCSKGHYFLLNFECEPNNLKEIETLFKFNESIDRYFFFKNFSKALRTGIVFFKKSICLENEALCCQ